MPITPIDLSSSSAYTGGASGVVEESSASVNIDTTHVNKIVRITNATAATITIQNDSTTVLPIGAVVMLAGTGTGVYTISPDVGVAILTSVGFELRAMNSAASLYKLAENEWLLAGDVV